jgi:hypothetical protein
VRPGSPGARFALGRCPLLGLGLTGRLDLFGLLQAQLELFLGLGLGPASKAMPLQLLDDLAQPLAFRPITQQHRREHVGVVEKSFDGGRHEAERIIPTNNLR